MVFFCVKRSSLLQRVGEQSLEILSLEATLTNFLRMMMMMRTHGIRLDLFWHQGIYIRQDERQALVQLKDCEGMLEIYRKESGAESELFFASILPRKCARRRKTK